MKERNFYREYLQRQNPEVGKRCWHLVNKWSPHGNEDGEPTVTRRAEFMGRLVMARGCWLSIASIFSVKYEMKSSGVGIA